MEIFRGWLSKLTLGEISLEDRAKEDLEPGILRELVISKLEEEPWKIELLSILSELSHGDEKRLYLLDILRSEPSDREFCVGLIIWEIEEESNKSSFKLRRLADRISNIISLKNNVEVENIGGLVARILSKALRHFYTKGEARSLIIGLKSSILATKNFPGLTKLLLK